MSTQVDADTILAVERRYFDAYLSARVIDGFGQTAKGLAIAFGVVGLLASLILGSQGGFGVPLGVITAGVAVAVGLILYVLGTLISAQGQLLKATLDTAVNSSPLLSDAARGRIMSLPFQSSTSSPSTNIAMEPGVTPTPRSQTASGSWRCRSCEALNTSSTTFCTMCGGAVAMR